jgi:hypothetical protein
MLINKKWAAKMLRFPLYCESINLTTNQFLLQFGPTFDTAGMAFGSQATREYSRGTSPEWLHMQVGGGFERMS